MQRVFLGWDGPLLARAAEWLIAELGTDLAEVVVALPGGRAGRLLEERLARAVGRELRPPRILTSGVLTDELLEVAGRPASRLVRTLAWERALRELPARELARLVTRPPGADEHARWAVLATEVRRLFAELAAEGLDFAHVAERALLDELPGERARWQVLAAAQARMVAHLAAADLHDPHLGRLAAIEARRLVGPAPAHVVLVGVVEHNALLRRTLALRAEPTTALVFADEADADGFDALGGLLSAPWCARATRLDLARWRVADRPADQADEALRALAGWGGRFRAEEITLGLCDAEVAPHLAGRLAEHGVRARDAAGTPIARTPVTRLVAAVAAFLRTRGYDELAALVRHPDLEAALRARLGESQPVELLDDYHARHLPWRTDGAWCCDTSDARDQKLRREMGELWSALDAVLGELFANGTAPAGAHVAATRALLERVYGERELDASDEAGRVLLASLRAWADVLEELEHLPAALAPELAAAELLELALRHASSPDRVVPPSGALHGDPTIEMMGWLELFLDDAPALVVTGFEDGQVPETVRGDAYLPGRLRRDLGLADGDQRLARDLYGTELLVRSRDEVVFVSGRRSAAGDPRVPSRVVFHCPEDEVAARVRRFIARKPSAPAPITGGAGEGRVLPRLAAPAAPEVMSVSAFKTWLESPYAYYLTHVLRLETLDDRARELDGAGFGNLAHAALQRFGQDEAARDERDAARIARYLDDALRQLVLELYGRAPLPAVRLQVEQLAWRLERFAALQAERRRAGWRIAHVEWKREVPMNVDGAPITIKGRIDRIDLHDDGRVAIWDYKTGDTIKPPKNAHRRRDGSWCDLQLPLYCHLAAELLGDGPPAELGYVALGRDESAQGFWSADDWRTSKKECDDPLEPLAGAFATAQDVVRRIRAGELYELGNWRPYDPIFEALGGVGLVAAMAAGDGDEEPGEEAEA
ncbi:MAG: PD-(D/E)XK nuclease family protein [Planctomycetes bacterium]|nr:PD-(D/E)XK nuclease family protein [Planctomycetota bacterium]